MEDWGRILGGIRATGRSLEAGEALFRDGDEARAVFQVERGRIRLGRHGATLHLAKTGSLLAESALFASHYACDAVADRPSRVKVFPKAAVLLYLRAHPDLNLAFSAALAREVQRLRAGQEIMRLPGARDRVVAWLTLLGAAETAVTLDQPLSAIASEIGLTHEALYRTLAALVKDGRLERPEKRSFRLK
ncbi:Crp/Fnr family transcriptional regulator [Paramagnetospirillum magneticum]|uniref:cAMP-binding protein-catabolite gene activator and regulatory subunit of cAMP-dependent protein kinase n=1 Tax=Paramagnetospirillum magneticum (strain ATCC 700264 / AMB-1) TaxID=342108 RepID=Q2VYI3_PARM1|nr:Crp/Fnr family transcriptional regulator [Paramagnetospirillum magneticum]BAE53342.1 cAMP-binding protein - catabolite gene activator and regulatory subunit of cAMP-dependent protein kinase [Paramagnetospirillum magneticum AMB-1]